MKTYNRKAIFEELKEHCYLSKEHDYMEVTQWANGEGWDINIYSQIGTNTFQLTWGEYKLLKKLIKKLNNENT